MLIQFNFKNFKSFREEATLDLSAAKMTEFSDRVVTVGSEKILPVAAIYGANASGKSNIYNAFEYMSDYVADSFKYGDEEEKFEEFRPTPFLFDSTSANAESSFEVYFTLPEDKSGRTYNYGFCINKEGVTEEWLNSKAKTARKYSTIFYRGTKDEELDLSGFPKSSRDNIQVALEKQVLIISLSVRQSEIGSLQMSLLILAILLPISLCHEDCQRDLWKIRMYSRRLWNTLRHLMSTSRILELKRFLRRLNPRKRDTRLTHFIR